MKLPQTRSLCCLPKSRYKIRLLIRIIALSSIWYRRKIIIIIVVVVVVVVVVVGNGFSVSS